MSGLVTVLGSVTPPGRMHRAVSAAMAAVPPDTESDLIDLAAVHVGYADGRPPEQMADDTAQVVQRISTAKAVVLASPVYRASFTGALKNLLDHLPVEALHNKPVGIFAMGATAHHYLGVDRHLRDVLAWFGALVAPTSVYLTSADFTDGQPTAAAVAELGQLYTTVLALGGIAASTPGPTPLAARRG